MKSLELKKDLYWLGVQDWDLKVFDIIMETEFGTTYNSFLLRGSEKTALIETAKLKFLDGYLEKIEELGGIDQVDYIIVNHTEPDHAGSVERLLSMKPDILVVGTPTALTFLKSIVNHDFKSIAVREGDKLSLGDKTLTFMPLPNLHWPDTMYTYVEEEKVLFTCDSFGCHYCSEELLLSQITDEVGYQRAFKYYYDNILGPFKPFMVKALKRIEGLPVELICTGHGPVIDCRIEELKEKYLEWSTEGNPNRQKTVVIPYVSAYGYTAQMAEEIGRGILSSGDITVKKYDMEDANPELVMKELLYADGILLGSSTILGEALEPIWHLAVAMKPGDFAGKLAAAFGSYGWSGEAVPHLTERLKQLKMNVMDGLKIRFKPSEEELRTAFEFGSQFGQTLLEGIGR